MARIFYVGAFLATALVLSACGKEEQAKPRPAPPPPVAVEDLSPPSDPYALPPADPFAVGESGPTLIGVVHFGFDRHNIDPAMVARLDELAANLKASKSHVVINGYADAHGPAAYNRSLSMKRAQAVRHYLLREGVRPGQMERFGGAGIAEDAVASQSRRVEVYLDE